MVPVPGSTTTMYDDADPKNYIGCQQRRRCRFYILLSSIPECILDWHILTIYVAYSTVGICFSMYVVKCYTIDHCQKAATTQGRRKDTGTRCIPASCGNCAGAKPLAIFIPY